MTLQAPPLYPDELVTSAIIRCCRRYGLTLKVLRRGVLDAPYWQPRFLCINALPALARLFRLPEEVLLWEHSTFPYAAAYLDDATFRRALACLEPESTNSNLGAVLQNSTAGQGFRRYCAACAITDARDYGEAYWHRTHNLPGVLTCSVHGSYLRVTTVPVSLSSRVALDLPGDGDSKPAGYGPPRLGLRQVTQASAAALASRPWKRPGAVSAASYRLTAQSSGWLHEGAQVNGERLNRLLAATFGRSYLAKWQVDPDSSVQSWPGLMLRDRTKQPFIPLKHILLDTALRAPRTVSDTSLSHRSSGPSARQGSTLDAACSQAARSVLLRLRAEGATSVTTEEFLRQANCWQTYRHRLADLPRLRAVVLKFRSSPMSVKQLRPGKMLYRSRPGERATTPP